MILKCLSTGSKANCYILKRDNGEMLILDAGLPINEIKKGIEFDVTNLKGALVTHGHGDHVLSAEKLKQFTPVWKPYLSEYKRQRTHLGDFEVECFDVYHNECPCRAFIITVGKEKILYATDFEMISYDLSKVGITVMLVELNYMSELVSDDNDHIEHLCRGHAEARTTLELIKHNSSKLHTVLFCHMSRSGNLDRAKVEALIPDYIPSWIKWHWCKAGETYQIDSVPF